MTFKSSRSAAAAVSGALGLLLVAATFSLAEEPSPSGNPAANPAVKPKFGYVRFFNGMPLSGINLDLVLGADPNARVLQNAQPASFFAGYINLPPARYQFRVFKSGDRLTPIKTIDLPLREKSYYTILASQPTGSPPIVEVIDETPVLDPDHKPSPNRLTVRQFCPTANVIVSATGKQTETLGYGKSQTLEGFPDALVPVTVRATLNPGGMKTSMVEADFRLNHRASIYVVTDPYGRLRVRLSMDGPTVAQEAADAAPPSPARTP